MSEILCFKHKKHHVYIESECPWCQIDRLKAELEEARKVAEKGQYQADYFAIRDALDISRIRNSNLELQLSEVTARYNDVCTIERVDLIKQQLAEARAGNERLKEEIHHYEDQGLWIPDKAEQTRQEAARELVEMFERYFDWMNDSCSYEAFKQAVKAKFGLEG